MIMDTYERRCRLLARAYPPRYRQTRGEELIGTLLDLAEPQQTRPTLRDSLDVVRGGIALRLRERPPLWHWALYRLFHKRLPYPYRWWARDDLLGSHYLARQCATLLLLSSPTWAFIGLLPPEMLPELAHTLIAPTLIRMLAFLPQRSLRLYQLRRHEFDLGLHG
ncbi:hypothetical protein ACGFNP_30525 [Nonomuraea sp. NPDC049269]|uniref:hypothetical protein n=1 Tax=Nonomuraea sp. NPDC049269 TaxID=3364349 RepID=UPI003712F26A